MVFRFKCDCDSCEGTCDLEAMRLVRIVNGDVIWVRCGYSIFLNDNMVRMRLECKITEKDIIYISDIFCLFICFCFTIFFNN